MGCRELLPEFFLLLGKHVQRNRPGISDVIGDEFGGGAPRAAEPIGCRLVKRVLSNVVDAPPAAGTPHRVSGRCAGGRRLAGGRGVGLGQHDVDADDRGGRPHLPERQRPHRERNPLAEVAGVLLAQNQIGVGPVVGVLVGPRDPPNEPRGQRVAGALVACGECLARTIVNINLSKPFRIEQMDDGAEELTIRIRWPAPGTRMDWVVACGNRRRPVHGPEAAIMLTMGIFAMARDYGEVRGRS